MRVRQPQGSHFHFAAGGRALGSAGGRLSSSWGSHLVASGLARVGAAAGAGFDRTWGSRRTCRSIRLPWHRGNGRGRRRSAAVLAGLAAGEEAHGRESDDGEDLHWFILSEIGRAKHGLTTSLDNEFYANLGRGGLKPALFTARVALCPLLNPKKRLGTRRSRLSALAKALPERPGCI